MRLRSVQRICSKIIAPFAGNHDVASGNRVVSEETRHKSATESLPMSYRCPMVVAKWSPKKLGMCHTFFSKWKLFLCSRAILFAYLQKNDYLCTEICVYRRNAILHREYNKEVKQSINHKKQLYYV